MVSREDSPRPRKVKPKGNKQSKQERKPEPRKDKPLAKVERIRALGIGLSIA